MTEEKTREEEMFLSAGSIQKQRDIQNHMANVLWGTEFTGVNCGFCFSLLRQMLLGARVPYQGQIPLFKKKSVFMDSLGISYHPPQSSHLSVPPHPPLTPAACPLQS